MRLCVRETVGDYNRDDLDRLTDLEPFGGTELLQC
jgi:hypothetical protein